MRKANRIGFKLQMRVAAFASANVEKDKGKLLCVEKRAKKFAKIGIISCTQYNDEKGKSC